MSAQTVSPTMPAPALPPLSFLLSFSFFSVSRVRLFIYSFITCGCVFEPLPCHSGNIEVRGQVVSIGSFLPPRESRSWTQVVSFGVRCLYLRDILPALCCIFKFDLLVLLYVWVFCRPVCVCPHSCLVSSEVREAIRCPRSGLQRAVSHHVGDGNCWQLLLTSGSSLKPSVCLFWVKASYNSGRLQTFFVVKDDLEL